MRIAVLSGKGGAGKTFVSVNLACAAESAIYVDCDVEEPNGHLFLKPDIRVKQAVTVAVPNVDFNKCVRCRKCVSICRYNALALLKNKLMVFYEVCHCCGGCSLLCPEKAITEKQREIGTIEEGISDNVTVYTGCLNTGEVSGVPIIKKLMGKLPKQETVIIDCPPGSSCTVMESIREADYCVLVAEPTLFGVHNLSMVHDLVSLFNKPFGVVINKYTSGDNPADQFCKEKNISILAQIPYDEKLGKLNSNGLIAVREDKQFNELFKMLLYKLAKEAIS